MVKILECSSKGDFRFSAFYAKVNFLGLIDTIENHYQSAKRFKGRLVHDPKGQYPDFLELPNGQILEKEFLNSFYKLLWIIYLDSRPDLVEYAVNFDTFTDMFKGKNTINCQADVIQDYVKKGRVYVFKDCKDIINKINNFHAGNV